MADEKKIKKLKRGSKVREAKIEEVDSGTKKISFKGKYVYFLVGVVVLLLLLLLGYFISQDEAINKQSFKQEYESLNGEKTSGGQTYLELNIDDEIIQYADYQKVFSLLDHGTGVIYFGFPECPWCRTLVPVLLDAADEVGLDTIYYLNNREDRDTKELGEDGKIVTTKEGTSNYYKLLDFLSPYLGEYEGLNDKDVKRLYFPTVIFVKEGEVVATHIGTLDTQTSGYQLLSDQQHDELKEVLINKMNKTITCDEYC